MKQKGMTLIELMIVIAIIGILASIAIPAYQNHITRARITEGFSLASAAQTSVSENSMTGNSDLSLGVNTPQTTDLVQSVVVNGGSGVITITYTEKAHHVVINLTPSSNGINLVAGSAPTGAIKWDCAVTDVQYNKYVPSNCRI